MAIAVASGKTGFDGNFSPIIYSKQAQIALRKAAVANAITNNSYFGEIANQGDVVRIQKEPDVTVNALERKTAISVQDLDDSDFQLTIDKANYFAFKMDDIEDQFASVDFVSLAADRAAYKMADAMDADLLSYMSGYDSSGALITTVSGTAQHPTANNLNGEFFSKQCSENPILCPCAFEYVYLARPDSIMNGISVYKARLKMGDYLAATIKESINTGDVDVVMPIPDSSRPAAMQVDRQLE